jgi:hypothetical protein
MGVVLKSDYTMKLSEADLDEPGHTHATKYVSYESNATSTFVTTDSIAFKACDRWDFQVWAHAPVLENGWVLLGEPSKWVPVSNARFQDLTLNMDGNTASASVTARGPPGEAITVAWLAPGEFTKPLLANCVMPAGGAVNVRVSNASSTEFRCVAV